MSEPLILGDPAVLARIVARWPDLTEGQRAQLAATHPVLWAMFASDGAWTPAPHLLYLAQMLMQLVAGTILRLCVSMPPQHGKSELISKYFPTWYLGVRPQSRILQFSYGQDLTVEWTGQGRDLFAEHGPAVFGVDTWAKAKRTAWDAYQEGRRTGGSVRGVGKGGGVTGRAVDLGLGDDVLKDQEEADSPAQRERAYKWLRSAVFPRAKRLGLIGTRWNHDDPIGRLMAAQARGEIGERWTFVNLPAVAEEGDPLGRKKGDGLWLANPLCGGDPDWYAKKQRDVGPYVWSALYQGRPTPLEGGIFKKAWVHHYDVDGGYLVGPGFRFPKEALFCYTTVDPAFSKKTSADHTAIASWGLDRQTGRLFLLKMTRRRFDAPEVAKAMRDDMAECKSSIAYVEANNAKQDQMDVIRKSGIPMREIQPNTDKVSRAMPVTAHMSAGKLLFMRNATWMPDLETELLTFGPGSEEDDQVDAISYGVHVANEMASKGGLFDVPAPTGGVPPRGGLGQMLRRPT